MSRHVASHLLPYPLLPPGGAKLIKSLLLSFSLFPALSMSHKDENHAVNRVVESEYETPMMALVLKSLESKVS